MPVCGVKLPLYKSRPHHGKAYLLECGLLSALIFMYNAPHISE